MTLSERLQSGLQAAIRDRDELRRDTLRMAIAAAYGIEKQRGASLTDEELVGVLAREVKTRRESIEAFRAGGRDDLADREEREVAVLSEFLPAPLSEDELLDLVRAAIAETGASSARDMGRVMGVLTPRTRGRADGKRVSGLVAQQLAQTDLASHDHG